MRHTSLILLALSPLFAIPLGCGLVLGLDEYKLAEPNIDAGVGDGSVLVPCVPAENDAPVADSCGVFLAVSGNDTGAGTKEHPVATFKVAIERAKAIGKPVYACAEQFIEPVEVPAGITIYGGLACGAGWTYVGITQKTEIRPPSGAIPLKLLAQGGAIHVEDCMAAALAEPLPGGSSIAAIASGSSVELVRCALIAGDGGDGEKGTTPTDDVGPLDPDAPAIRGEHGSKACSGGANDNLGGAGKQNLLCVSSTGGNGGKGMTAAGGDGADGQPLPSPNPTNAGGGGAGDSGAGKDCVSGINGEHGASGVSGIGATGLGQVTEAGYIGAFGGSGAVGGIGQGGGGGGGAKGKLDCGGASGGGGGAGGCGGRGGNGGQAGGSSIALINLSASITFSDVTLQAGIAGDGGEGGYGQDGGVGGNGGNLAPGIGTLPSCGGGQGGYGGYGGKGGGGRGGHSIGIAYKGPPPSTIGATIQIGVAGEGGLGEGPNGNGATGIKADIKAFP